MIDPNTRTYSPLVWRYLSLAAEAAKFGSLGQDENYKPIFEDMDKLWHKLPLSDRFAITELIDEVDES